MAQGLIILAVAALLGVRLSGPFGLPGALALTIVTMFFIVTAFGELGMSIASRLDSIEGLQVVLIFLMFAALFPKRRAVPSHLVACVDESVGGYQSP